MPKFSEWLGNSMGNGDGTGQWTPPAPAAPDPYPDNLNPVNNPYQQQWAPVSYSQAAAPAPAPSQAFQGGGGGGGGMQAPQGPSAADIAAQQQASRKAQMDQWEHMNDDDLSHVDSTFGEQLGMYRDKLAKYVADYDNQLGTHGNVFSGVLNHNGLHGDNAFDGINNHVQTDLGGTMGKSYVSAADAIARNRNLGLRNTAEDFANRGMMNSGLYTRDFGLANDGYDRQLNNLNDGTQAQIQNLDFNRGNFTSDNQAQIATARRDALNRLAQSQSVV
jgi:hypothetical protein